MGVGQNGCIAFVLHAVHLHIVVDFLHFSFQLFFLCKQFAQCFLHHRVHIGGQFPLISCAMRHGSDNSTTARGQQCKPVNPKTRGEMGRFKQVCGTCCCLGESAIGSYFGKKHHLVGTCTHGVPQVALHNHNAIAHLPLRRETAHHGINQRANQQHGGHKTPCHALAHPSFLSFHCSGLRRFSRLCCRLLVQS